MSVHAIETSPAFRAKGFHQYLTRLLEHLSRRSALSRDIGKLSDHLLVDIGVDPRAVSNPGRHAADTLQLLECGWRSPPRKGR